MMAVVSSGRAAQTHYELVRRFEKFTLIKATLSTGRTHQIRVHMASLGFPVVGDIVYNRKTTGTLARRNALGLSGQALHAAYLSFIHPVTGELLKLEAPMPADFQNLIDRLSQ
jgi:23S rRNA pseudouridine1911/1915/1917 synthase